MSGIRNRMPPDALASSIMRVNDIVSYPTGQSRARPHLQRAGEVRGTFKVEANLGGAYDR
jgi:hypothetical protein